MKQIKDDFLRFLHSSSRLLRRSFAFFMDFLFGASLQLRQLQMHLSYLIGRRLAFRKRFLIDSQRSFPRSRRLGGSGAGACVTH